MRATKIEITTAALRAGRVVDGKWQPGGQVLGTVWVEHAEMAEEVAERLRVHGLGGEPWTVTVVGREDIPQE